MSFIKTHFHPLLPTKPLLKLKTSITTRGTFLKKDSIVILVCGANNSTDVDSGRKLILDYANKNLKNFKFFQAEQIFDTLLSFRKDTDFLSLENEFSSFTDCIIIVLESPGAFAELGAFAIKDDIVKILLLLNDTKYENDKSFINLGPIAKADKVSRFKPTIFYNPDYILKYAHFIEERLSRIKRKKNKSIILNNFDKFLSCPPKIKILFIADLVSIFSPISKRELYKLLRFVYDFKDRIDLDVELSTLQALNIIDKIDEYYVRTSAETETYFYFDGANYIDIRSETIIYYYKYNRGKSSILSIRK